MKTENPMQYYKDFANGKLNKYNHIKPLIDVYGKDFNDKDLYGENGLVALLAPYQNAYNDILDDQLFYINKCTTKIKKLGEPKTEGYIKSAEFCLNRMYQIVANYVEAKKNQKKKEN